jgi:hypothetical protein
MPNGGDGTREERIEILRIQLNEFCGIISRDLIPERLKVRLKMGCGSIDLQDGCNAKGGVGSGCVAAIRKVVRGSGWRG